MKTSWMHPARLLAIAGLALVLSAGTCLAQGRGGSGGSGGSGFGGSSQGGFGGSSSGFSTSPSSSGGGGSSSLFNSGMSGPNTGYSQSSSSSSLFNSSSASNSGSSGSSSGVGQSQQGVPIQNDITIGTSGAPLSREATLTRGQGVELINSNPSVVYSGQSANSNQRNQQLQSIFSMLGSQGNFNQSGQRTRPSIRIPLRLGFQARPVAAPQFTSTFQNRLKNLPGLAGIGPITVEMEGTTAILKGVVASEADRRLAYDVAMLEPEVSEVQNLLTVQEATPGEPSASENP